MKKSALSQNQLQIFSDYLRQEEKSSATQEKYLRDARGFISYAAGRPVTKELVTSWKQNLIENGYAVRSINSMIASVNSFLGVLNRQECRVKSIRLQRQVFCPEEKELTKNEYMRLLEAAKGNDQLYLLLQTICGTGIRVSELKYFTVAAVRCGEITVSCKSKMRTSFVPDKLKKMLLNFAKQNHIADGLIFTDGNGNPIDRSSVWRQMKRLCTAAGVQASKVYPHNLRKLFTPTFYNIEKDIAKLADILGHSSINTTRIYIMTTGAEHRRQMDRLGLLI